MAAAGGGGGSTTGSGGSLPPSATMANSTATAPHGASATSRSSASNRNHHSSNHHQHTQSQSQSISNTTTSNSHPVPASSSTHTRLSRGNSFRIPLPPNTTSSSGGGGTGGAISPNSPGGHSQQLGTSYGSTNSSTGGSGGGGRLANLVGFRRNRGASTNRGELTSPPINTSNSTSNYQQPHPSPPATFSPLQTSTSLTEFGSVVGGGGGGPASPDVATDMEGVGGQVHTGGGGGQQTPGGSTLSSTRGYFTRRGFGRKNTGSGLLSGVNAGSSGGNRTPTSEIPSTTSTTTSTAMAMARSRSSSQPSLPLSHASNNNNANISHNPPLSANAISGTGTTTASTGGLSSSVSGPILGSSTNGTSIINYNHNNDADTTLRPRATAGGSSSNSSRRPSGEAARTNSTDRAAASNSMHHRNPSQAAVTSTPITASTSTQAINQPPTTTTTSSESQHIRLVPHLESTRSLHFDPVSRDVPPTIPLRIGRFTDRNPNQPISALDQNRVAFKSKVVSRTHAEIWFDPTPIAMNTGSANGGGWFIRDLKSSSGTFLNHIRLSGAGMESRPFPIRDGDVLQLGVDYQGGTEEIYRCVKMRIELNRGWQRGANQFNTNALRQIRALGNVPNEAEGGTSKEKKTKKKKKKSKRNKQLVAEGNALGEDENGSADEVMLVEETKKPVGQTASSGGVTDCCICLFSVTVYQALFIAPCSHIFHFKCIRPLLLQHHPGFSCPLCRTFADLEADVEQDDIPEPIVVEEEESSEGEEESEEEEEEVQADAAAQVDGEAPALPDKDQRIAPVNVPAPVASTSTSGPTQANDNTFIQNIAPPFGANEANLETLRPGRKSPHIPSSAAFAAGAGAGAGASSTAPNVSQRLGGAAASSRSPSARVSLEGGRPASPGPSASGRRTPPSRGSRRGSSKHPPLSGSAVVAALEAHRTPSNSHGNDSFSPPSAGDFDPDIRRSSIFVHGADGHGMQIPITGRSRPSSVYDVDVHSEHGGSNTGGGTVSPSALAAAHAGEKTKARSVKSLRMTQSRASMGSLRNAAASPSHATASSAAVAAVGTGNRRHPSAPSSSDEDDFDHLDDDFDDPPHTARPMTAGEQSGFTSEQYPFPEQLARYAPTGTDNVSVSAIPITGATAAGNSDEQDIDDSIPLLNREAGVTSTTNAAQAAVNQDNTPPSDQPSPSSPQDKGKGKSDGPVKSEKRATTSPPKPPSMPESSASFHAIV